HTRSLRDWSSDVCSSDLFKRRGRDQRQSLCLLSAFIEELPIIADKAGRFCASAERFGSAELEYHHRRSDAAQVLPEWREIHVARSEERRVGEGCRAHSAR